MREGVSLSLNLNLLNVLLLFLYVFESCCSPMNYLERSVIMDGSTETFLPEISPAASPQPFLPLLAPSPLVPFTNSTVPKLSGLCMLNFTAAESVMRITSIDCWSAVAPVLANVICCPQLESTLVILIGQSSRDTNVLALNATIAKHCLSDIEQILVGQGASDNLQQICSIRPSNLTEGSCPVKDVNEFESSVDTSKLLAACEKIDPVKECCDQNCQNAISDAASSLALRAYDLLSVDRPHILPQHLSRIDGCKSIVLRWLASRLDPSHAKELLRGLSNCNINKVCPLKFADTKYVAKGCGLSNQTACCSAMESYLSHVQKQSLITNLQALDCAAMLGMKLQKSNITKNVFNLCHISLKDFSLQSGFQESGCLLPSLPSDVTFDSSSGIGFICDLNDNIPAPWPSASQLPASSCNKTVKIPALPAAASAQSGLYNEDAMSLLIIASSAVLIMLM